MPFTLTDELLAEDALVAVVARDVPTTVTILKLDTDAVDGTGTPTGSRVAGATLTLTRKADAAVLGTFTFDGIQDWVLGSGELRTGETYVLTETVAGTPDGYLCAYSQEFTLVGDGTDRWIVVDEPVARLTISVTKVWNDSATTHPDAVFDLYRSDNPTVVRDSATLTAPATSVTFENLPRQSADHTTLTYTVRERTADGYLPGVLTSPEIIFYGKLTT